MFVEPMLPQNRYKEKTPQDIVRQYRRYYRFGVMPDASWMLDSRRDD